MPLDADSFARRNLEDVHRRDVFLPPQLDEGALRIHSLPRFAFHLADVLDVPPFDDRNRLLGHELVVGCPATKLGSTDANHCVPPENIDEPACAGMLGPRPRQSHLMTCSPIIAPRREWRGTGRWIGRRLTVPSMWNRVRLSISTTACSPVEAAAMKCQETAIFHGEIPALPNAAVDA